MREGEEEGAHGEGGWGAGGTRAGLGRTGPGSGLGRATSRIKTHDTHDH
jgi:hypothetical protein